MGDLAERDLSSALAHGLGRCAAICRQTLESYEPSPRGATNSELAGGLMRTTAALQAALRLHTRDAEVRDVALRIACESARVTATLLRASGLDERLLRCADACERVCYLCEDVLADDEEQAA
jgi:hypothetical protein